jgi:hypothetical protein
MDGRGNRQARRGRGPVVVGAPEEVAEEQIAWVEDTDVDGFNLAYGVMPETFVNFVNLVVPELQARGRYKRDYAPGTLREKLFGQGRARLGADHPAFRFRNIADLLTNGSTRPRHAAVEPGTDFPILAQNLHFHRSQVP